MRIGTIFRTWVKKRYASVVMLSGLFLVVVAISYSVALRWSIRITFRQVPHTLEVPAVSSPAGDVRLLAEAAVRACMNAPEKPTCYEEQIPKAMDSVSMEDAFQVTRVVQDMDPAYAYCHVLGHKLAAKETAKDPAGWKTVITRCPSGVCSNGCIHGAFQERFRTETLTDAEIEQHLPELLGVCEPRTGWTPTGLEQGTCYHALGHLVMYITDADIQKAVSLCERMSRPPSSAKDWSQLCFDGAFMQIFQPLENEDFVLVKDKVPTVAEMPKFCAPFKGLQREPCWAESWPLQRDVVLQPKGLTAFCESSLLTTADKNRCYTGMFYVIMAQFQLSTEKMRTFCNGLASERMGQCFANGASRMIETDYRNVDAAVAFCKSAASVQAQSACFDEMVIYASYDFKPGAPEQLKLCEELPVPWRDTCLAQAKR